jgi:hypothetical protein
MSVNGTDEGQVEIPWKPKDGGDAQLGQPFEQILGSSSHRRTPRGILGQSGRPRGVEEHRKS